MEFMDRAMKGQSEATAHNVSPADGFIYLLHWRDRDGRVEHYVGWTQDLEARLKAHFSDSGGCPTTRRYRKAGMRGALARLWRGTIWGERLLQQTLEFPQNCPICCGGTVGPVACEGWIQADASPPGPLKPWNRCTR